MILCDIGNSTFHFQTNSKAFKISIQDSLKKIKNFNGKLYFVSVNEEGTKKLLKHFPKAVDIAPYIKFHTAYKGMGIDRQLVCKYIYNGIIVDIGSAITIDIMKNTIHQGGIILPGFNAYKKIYPKISKKLSFKFKTDINLDKIPLKTEDAINYSILNSIITPIKNIYETHKVPIYFTGEDSKLILAYFKEIPHKYKKNLIFNSMKKVIKENKC
jgi:type III pantothenate kinase